MSGKHSNPRNMSAAQVKSRIDKLMASKLQEDEEFGDVMDYLQGLVGNSEVTERQLRLALQDRELELNRQFLENFEKINTEVQGFVDKIRNMNTICTELTARIQTNKERTQSLLSKTSLLQNEKKQLLTQQAYINNFFEKFSLSADEERILAAAVNEVAVSDQFFKCLQRLCAIEENTRSSLHADPENAALTEIHGSLKEKLESAFTTLFQATQRECRLLNVEFLELKPVLPQRCRSRHAALRSLLVRSAKLRGPRVHRCVDQRGRGASKPIEQLSADALRYCSEVTGAIHQVLELESELLKSLLKACNPEIIQSPLQADAMRHLRSLSASRSKLRVEQTLTRESNCVVLYRLSSLFLYWARQFETAMSEEADIVKTLLSLHQLGEKMFFSVVSTTVQKITSSMTTPDYDLLPVHAIHQVLLLLRDVLESQKRTRRSRSVVEKREMYSKIFAHVLDPLNQSILLVCSNLHNPLDVAAYMLNCLNEIRTVLIMYQAIHGREARDDQGADRSERGRARVSEQASNILAKTEMLQIYTKCVAHSSNQCSQTNKVSSSRSRETVQRRTFENVIGAYSVIHQKLVDPSNLYTGLEVKSVEEVTAKLLSQT
ncbi:Conserved oligomeric Golgi complex subunit 6 [Aphelenchoides fujianensis]|nr:Conserved oligomeric Golgi complex subunit 6 [Aphelenchoides fujianensis]